MNETTRERQNQEQHAPHLVVDNQQLAAGRLKVTVVSHSPLFYWWPVWLLGFVFGLLAYFQVPETFVHATLTNPGADITSYEINLTTNKMGVIYCVLATLIVLITNVTLRGWLSIIVVVSIMFVTLLFAYLGWWDAILRWFGRQEVFMNSGFYFFFSTLLLILWLTSFFIFDRLNYWVFVPGQAINKKMVGLGERTYDISGMSVYKMRNDLFRHWILGLGSGDLHITTSGAESTEVMLPNVLFIGSKIDRIQTLVAIKPDQFEDLVSGGAPQ